KKHTTDQIIHALREILDGRVYLSSIMSQKLLSRATGQAADNLGRTPVEDLSDRELEVYSRIGEGTKTEQIARELHLSVKTIETYRDRIRLKLDLKDGLELVRSAVEWRLEKLEHRDLEVAHFPRSLARGARQTKAKREG